MPFNPFAIESDALPEGSQVVAFEGTEAISRPYVFDIDLSIPVESISNIHSKDALAKPVSLKWLDELGTERSVVHGVIGALELVDEGDDFVGLRVRLVPRLSLMGLSRHSLVFVKQSVPDILKFGLDGNGLKDGDDYTIDLTRDHPPLEHVCMYRESWLDFLSRWMEHEGIYYWFKHDGEKELLYIADDKARHEELGTPRPFLRRGAGDREGIASFRALATAKAKKVTLTDHAYQNPGFKLEASKEFEYGISPRKATFFGEDLSWLDDADKGSYTKRLQDELDALAGIRGEEQIASYGLFEGRGPVYDLRSGYTFELTDHPRENFNIKYLTTSLRHSGPSGPQFGTSAVASSDPVYEARFQAIPADVQFRPERRTPKPRIQGLESGVVDGPGDGPYAQLDDDGRYLVKMGFDEMDSDPGKASTRIRMLQPHGGAPEGFHLPLRKGTEVLLAFMGGDPDRPVIVGAVHDAHHPSVVTHQNEFQNIIQTQSENRIVLDDQEPYVEAFSPEKKSFLHLGKEKTGSCDEPTSNFELHTDGDGTVKTGQNLVEKVGANETVDVGGDVNETIQGAVTRTVNGGETETINSGLTETVNGGVTETINGGLTETVNGAMTETINGGVTRMVAGAVNETIAAALTQNILGAGTITAVGGYTINGIAGINFISAAPINLTAPTFNVNTGPQFAVAASLQGFTGNNFQIYGLNNQICLGANNQIQSINIQHSGLTADNAGVRIDSKQIWLIS